MAAGTDDREQVKCMRCEAWFHTDKIRGYCDACIKHLGEVRRDVNRRQRPAPGIFADGTFTNEACPQTVLDHDNEEACGLCGSNELESGFGLGSGYGYGSYTFCLECSTFLNFHACED